MRAKLPAPPNPSVPSRPVLAAAAAAVLFVATGMGGPAAAARRAGPNAPPSVKVPREVYVLPGEPASFAVLASDEDGDAVSLQLTSPPVAGGSLASLGGGVWEYTIAAGPELAGAVYVLAFEASDGNGGVATRSVPLHVGFPRGANPPRVTGPARVTAPVGRSGASASKARRSTEALVEVVEPDGGPVTVTAEAASGLPVAVRTTSDPSHFALVVTPTGAQRGQMVLTRVTATDADGNSSFADVLVEVPSGTGGEVVPVEVWWVARTDGDPFDAPQSADVTERTVSQTTATGDPGDLLGFAVYASSTADFEPGPETLVALAPPSLRSVFFSRERAAGDTGPLHVKVTARRTLGESRASADADTEEPHVPQGVTFRAGKLTVPDVRANFRPGTAVEVRQAADAAGERFALERARGRWVVKKRATGSPGGLRLADVLLPGQQVFLVAINPDGRASNPVPFVP